MKTILTVLVNILLICTNSIYSQTIWYQQSIDNDKIQVSFPGKPEKMHDPVSNSDMYLFDNVSSNFIVIGSPPSNSSLNDMHSSETIRSIENVLTEFNREQIISTTKTYYKNKKSLDVYYRKFFQNSFYLYHRARSVQVSDNYLVILLYTYVDYNSSLKEKFFNSLVFENEKKTRSSNSELFQYSNHKYKFSFNYPNSLSKLSDRRIVDINNAPYNKQMDISFEAGFENTKNENPPLILIYILKKQQPSDFKKIVEKYTYNEIDVSSIVDAFNNIMPLLNSANIDKPIIDLENNIMIFSSEVDATIWSFESKGKGMFVQFYGKEKIVQINCVSTVNRFKSDFDEYFLPIISSFSFNNGYKYTEANNLDVIDENSPFYNPVQDFLSGYTSTYKCNGTGKGRGLKFNIKYPQSWKSEEGNRPHIVRKFSNDDMSVQTMLIVNDLEYIPSEEEIDYFFSTESAKEMIPKGGHYIKSSKTVIDGESALVVDYSIQREKLGTIFKMHTRMYSIIYKSYLLQVQFAVSQVPLEPPIDLEKKFIKNELLFNSMINSLILISKWEDY